MPRDLDLISEYGSQTLGSSNAAGLAIFSDSQKGFWQAFELPHGPRNRVTFDTSFYVRQRYPRQIQPHLRPPHQPPRVRLV
jgi:hypothetical protein